MLWRIWSSKRRREKGDIPKACWFREMHAQGIAFLSHRIYHFIRYQTPHLKLEGETLDLLKIGARWCFDWSALRFGIGACFTCDI